MQMKLEDVQKLRVGDEVWWDDPDDLLCSQCLLIESIRIKGEVVVILGEGGICIECLPQELRKPSVRNNPQDKSNFFTRWP